MTWLWNCSLKAAFLFVLLLLCGGPVRTQTFQFLPQVDVYSTLNPDIRFNFEVKETREAGQPTQVQIGPGFDFFLKPLISLDKLTRFDSDRSKSRMLQLFAGFLYVPSPNEPHTERLVVAATPHLPLPAGILLSDRNRFDLDWSEDKFSWRYRNRLTLERRISVGSYHPAPYLSAETFYQSTYQKWSTTALYAGCLFPVDKTVEIEPYYEHQNFTGKHPNQQYNMFGLILDLYF